MISTSKNSIFRHINFFWGFFSYRLAFVVGLVFIAGFLDSLGIMLIIPVLQAGLDQNVISNDDTNGFIINFITEFVTILGIQGNMTFIILLMILVFFIKGIISFISQSYGQILKGELLENLRLKAFKLSSAVSLMKFFEYPIGHYNNICNEQPSRIASAYTAFLRFLSNLILSLIYLIVCWLISPNMLIAFLSAGIFILLAYRKLNTRVSSLSRDISNDTGVMSSSIIQALAASKYLRATLQMDNSLREARKANKKISKSQVKIALIRVLAQTLREPLAILIIGLLLIIEVQYFGSSLASLLVMVALLQKAINSITVAQADYLTYAEFSGAIELYSQEINNLQYHQEISGELKIENFSPSIKFKNVDFYYSDNDKSFNLSNLNFTINPYTSVAIVGPSGGGKSTILDLIARSIKPKKGEIFLSNQLENELDKESWRNKLGYITQNSVVFDETIANNIAPNKLINVDKDILQVEIESAAKAASLHEFIMQLPNKYETKVGENGINLSGGQRQRLFIARELFRNPEVLLLDEATSALDTETELAIRDTIELNRKKMTIIAVAHRLASIRSFDYVLVVERGKIVEAGAMELLLKNPETKLSKLIKAQKM
jgi:subfamily B ATP-binding cassette protein MsbA